MGMLPLFDWANEDFDLAAAEGQRLIPRQKNE